MHMLRTSLTLTRLVLAWFMLTFGVAVAAPVIAPHTLVMLCSHDGAKAVVLDADGNVVTTEAPGLDCPLCLPVTAPPPSPSLSLRAAATPFPLPTGLKSGAVSAQAGAPLPARGPPLRACVSRTRDRSVTS